MSDLLGMAFRERDEVAMYDHDAKDPLLGHGGRCYRNCKPKDVTINDRWFEGGLPVTDPERILYLEKRAREQGA